MRNFKLTIEYDGTDFHGWQVQPDVRTVQGEIIRALGELGRRVSVTGAGRTDAGVHAAGQVASARLETRLDAPTLARALDAKLPPDVRVRRAEEAPLAFNARFDARSRTYRYILTRRPSALWRRYFHYHGGELDLRAMRRAALELHGEHDFSSFSSSADTSKAKACRVMTTALAETPPLLSFEITADHFLHTMVRAIVGTLIEIGSGKPLNMKEILEQRDRRAAGPTLPPNGLYLVEVGYERQAGKIG
ncbi:MAG TPA: tRNA pseudouridine(38-40) synthase TruA [Candidatus Eisenbacteria bacterium]|uniref:tRNA pseudouridine synthase A n=1 Tax=Eiseniibacteriota bacterium TaxID=2212470 RepID=A0A7V2AU73_UNCEI|nr:tRNA pseudouridine(38-40) synthase TruA [Candidatus Eisenbacteria bacterium]